MPQGAKIYRGTVWEDAGACSIARVLIADGTVAQQADISSIAFYMWDDDGDNVVDNEALTVGNVVFDSLQTDDPRWPFDDIGFNFFHAIAAANFANGGERYRVEYWFTPASGEVFPLIYELDASPTKKD